ncbi:MAG TPA: hypothetical protein VH394_11725 [Thermoanaerobaculia bacterium]|nr:hypothetical protein [Thermoanaerobaculia bacterium]
MVITNPDGRLRFPADTTKALTLPKSGDWVEFEVSGEQPSAAKDDAVIEVHQDTADGADLGRQTMTVFSFESQLRLIRGGDYVLGTINGNYALAADPAPAVKYEADATLKPAGLDCSAPPLRDIRIGFVQEGLGERSLTFDKPSNLVCQPGDLGKKVKVAASQSQRFVHQNYVRDADNAAYLPLYSQEEQALAVPLGCPEGKTAWEVDMPTLSAFPTADLSIPGGTVTYSFKSMAINDAFRIWSVSFDTAAFTVVPLRESEWYLKADSSNATGSQGVTMLPGDRAPTRAPLTSGPLFNDPASFTKSSIPQGEVELVCH